ncbi:accessory gene regulator B family protein [Paenibacillus sp. GYB004]|uniref:accessory gene regulator ArgB-like protein n=1 Tax=Paenibacillus sp. GYB004 TaxID=2994393 RepID=UPI002F96C3DE
MMTIEQFAEKMATSLKQSNPDINVSIPRMRYALAGLINVGLVLALTGGLGAITGSAAGALTAMAAFVLLRTFSGGYHVKSLELCVIVSTLLFVLIPMVPFPDKYTAFLTVLVALIVAIRSPVPHESNRIPAASYPFLKAISIMVVCSNLFIGSAVIALAFAAQAILLIPSKGGEPT